MTPAPTRSAPRSGEPFRGATTAANDGGAVDAGAASWREASATGATLSASVVNDGADVRRSRPGTDAYAPATSACANDAGFVGGFVGRFVGNGGGRLARDARGDGLVGGGGGMSSR